MRLRIFDAHAHLTRRIALEEVVARWNEAGVARAALMARETDEARLLELARRWPLRARPLIGGRLFQRALQAGARRDARGGMRRYRGFREQWWRRRGEAVFAALERELDSGRFHGVGEVRLKHKGEGPGVPEMKCDYDFDPDHPQILRLLATAAARRAAVVVHLEVDRDAASRLRAFSAALDAVPRARVVWAHGGPCAPQTLEQMLDRHPNLRAEVQTLGPNGYAPRVPMLRTFPPLTEPDGDLLPAWRRVLERHAGRLMFGSDCRTPAEYAHLRERADALRRVCVQLSPRAARALAWDAAERLYGRRD